MSFNNLRALTFGSATIDVIAIVPDEDIERMTMTNATSSFLLLEEGRKIDVSSITSSVGGGATNAGVALVRLGFSTRTFIRTGDDLEGKEIAERLKTEGIDTDLIIRDDTMPTGKAIMVTSHVCNPTIFTNRGANTTLLEKEIKQEIFTDQHLVYVASLSGNSAACLTHIVRSAKASGAFVATNPGIRQLTYWAGDMIEALQYVDLISMNAVEAEQLALTLLPKINRIQNTPEYVEGPVLLNNGLAGRSLEEFVAEVCKLGPKIVLITNGAEGAYAGTKDDIEFYAAGKAEVGNTAGAGDSFATTFSAFASIGADIITCLKSASANALSVIAAPDTHSGLLTETELVKAVK